MIGFLQRHGQHWIYIGLAMAIAVTYCITALVFSNDVTSCQEENKELLVKALADAEVKRSVFYETRLLEKDLQLINKDNELDSLRKKMALDSADRMSLIDAMRTINQRYQRQK